MYLLNKIVKCKNRTDRIEIFPFYDLHIGKFNCAEDAIKKQIGEILKRNKMPNRHVLVVFGGDNLNMINTADRRFDFAELADWFLDSDAETVRERLGDMVNQEINHAVELFSPIKDLILGALYGGHEKRLRTSQNIDVHSVFCTRLGITNLTDEAVIRIQAQRMTKSMPHSTSVIRIYLRHGYGSGRTAGAEPNKLDRMLSEWEEADVCLSGHTHTFNISPPKPVAIIPRRGRLPETPHYRYRFAANPGCWLYSHHKGMGTYESGACYPARPMMTLKIVIWPFWRGYNKSSAIDRPKIELRQYPIL